MIATSCDRVRLMGLGGSMLNKFIRPDEIFMYQTVPSWLIIGGPGNGQTITYLQAVEIANVYFDSCTPEVICDPLFSQEFNYLFECINPGCPTPVGAWNLPNATTNQEYVQYLQVPGEGPYYISVIDNAGFTVIIDEQAGIIQIFGTLTQAGSGNIVFKVNNCGNAAADGPTVTLPITIISDCVPVDYQNSVDYSRTVVIGQYFEFFIPGPPVGSAPFNLFSFVPFPYIGISAEVNPTTGQIRVFGTPTNEDGNSTNLFYSFRIRNCSNTNFYQFNLTFYIREYLPLTWPVLNQYMEVYNNAKGIRRNGAGPEAWGITSFSAEKLTAGKTLTARVDGNFHRVFGLATTQAGGTVLGGPFWPMALYTDISGQMYYNDGPTLINYPMGLHAPNSYFRFRYVGTDIFLEYSPDKITWNLIRQFTGITGDFYVGVELYSSAQGNGFSEIYIN